MARTGLYPSQVKKARDSLLAQGHHPSVDAVRVALGNTGSKTTIHKYLKELEAEEGGSNGNVSISDALQDLVERLAARLQGEADARLSTAIGEYKQREELLLEKQGKLEADIARLHREVDTAQEQLRAGQTLAEQSGKALQEETIRRHTAEQQVGDLKDRLAENTAHSASLEEKHAHARQALEHYRQATKEQRDQDQRRHEQQIQMLQAELRQHQQTIAIKHEEVTRLNQEGVRLVAELAHAKQALYEQQSLNRRQERKIEGLQVAQVHAAEVGRQLAARTSELESQNTELNAARSHIGSLQTEVHNLHIELAQAVGKAAAQQSLAAQLRDYLDGLKP